MRFNPDQLVTLAAVAREGNLTRAAERLHLTQPAVSTQMSKLSRAVGEPVYRRHRLGITLTPAGQAILPHAQAVARALENAEAAADALRGLTAGTARVAASTTIATYLLPEALARLHRAHPGVRVDVHAGNTGDVVERLERGDAELALVEGPVHAALPGIERHVVLTDEIVLVTRPDHPLAARERRLEDLRGLNVVRREPGSGTREVVERALTGAALNPVLDLAGSEAVKEAVILGLGAAFLSRLAVERDVRAGFLAATRVLTPGLERPFTLLRPPLEDLSRAARAFVTDGLEPAAVAPRERT